MKRSDIHTLTVLKVYRELESPRRADERLEAPQNPKTPKPQLLVGYSKMRN